VSSARAVKRFFRPLRALVLLALDAIAALRAPAPRPRRVLVVRLDAIGDFILWLDAARHLRTLFPEAEITLLANAPWASFAEALPHWDRVWPLDRRRFVRDLAYRWRTVRALRAAGFATALQPTFSRELLFGDAAVRASGAPERIGSRGDLANETRLEKRVGDRWYTRLLAADERPLMELERNAELVRALGLVETHAALPRLAAPAATPDGLPPGDFYVLIPGGSSPGKRWPLARFAELARRMRAATGLPGVVVGGEEEADLAARLVREADAALQSRAGRTSLADLAALLARARIAVGNDTGAIHIAAALGTPTVLVLGGGHYGRFFPYAVREKTRRPLPVPVAHKMPCYGCNWRCTYDVPEDAPLPCVDGVALDRVVAAALRAVARPRVAARRDVG
jgi:ADP-heptose:LPS heptosyltransferase